MHVFICLVTTELEVILLCFVQIIIQKHPSDLKIVVTMDCLLFISCYLALGAFVLVELMIMVQLDFVKPLLL